MSNVPVVCVQQQEADQHQRRADHRDDEEAGGRPAAPDRVVLVTPVGDDEPHRDQHELEEHEEHDQVEGQRTCRCCAASIRSTSATSAGSPAAVRALGGAARPGSTTPAARSARPAAPTARRRRGASARRARRSRSRRTAAAKSPPVVGPSDPRPDGRGPASTVATASAEPASPCGRSPADAEQHGERAEQRQPDQQLEPADHRCTSPDDQRRPRRRRPRPPSR